MGWFISFHMVHAYESSLWYPYSSLFVPSCHVFRQHLTMPWLTCSFFREWRGNVLPHLQPHFCQWNMPLVCISNHRDRALFQETFCLSIRTCFGSERWIRDVVRACLRIPHTKSRLEINTKDIRPSIDTTCNGLSPLSRQEGNNWKSRCGAGQWARGSSSKIVAK